MIKYRLICKNCDLKFDSWFASSLEYEKLKKKKFLNLNDCEIKTKEKCKNLLNLVGECDVLISQFSYAAWKGGIDNLHWRKKAAKEKLDTLALQVNQFKPKLLIPFASYVYFSNISIKFNYLPSWTNTECVCT